MLEQEKREPVAHQGRLYRAKFWNITLGLGGIYETRQYRMTAPVWLSRTIHLVSAFWTLGLAILIFLDVTGRGLFSQPIPGTKEIIQNSIVAITFLQLPLAIFSGSMLRTSVFADAVPKSVRRILRTICYLLGVALFIGLLISSWEPLMDAIRIGEYEGEGALRVPVWPLRGVILFMSGFCIFAYMIMIYYDWSGKLIDENEAPGCHGRLNDGRG